MIESARYTESGSIVALVDGVEMTIPDDMANRHRIMLAENGAVIAPYVPPPAGVEDYKNAIVTMLDAKARQRRYDNAVSISTYVNSTNPQWASEATAFVAWRDAVWSYTYGEMDKVMKGLRPQPTVAEILAELPEMVWPT